MATSDLSELVAIPLREKIPHFSGYLGEQRVQDWLTVAERIAKGANWTKDQMKRYFCERFNNLAHSFQEKLEAVGSPRRNLGYDDWKKVIIEEFKDPAESETFKAELNLAKQRDEERVRDFVARIEKIFIKGYGEDVFKSTNNEVTQMREEILKKSLQNGMKSDLATGYWYRVKPEASYKEAVDVANEVENFLRRKGQQREVSTANISAISLHQEVMDEQLKSLEGKVDELRMSHSSQGNLGKIGDIAVISTTSGNTGNPHRGGSGRPNDNGRAVRISVNSSEKGRSKSRDRGQQFSRPKSRSPSGDRNSSGRAYQQRPYRGSHPVGRANSYSPNSGRNGGTESAWKAIRC